MQRYEPNTEVLVELPSPRPLTPELEARAIAAMQAQLEGKLVNASESRAVGHHWLRNPKLAPKPQITQEIERSLAKIDALDPAPGHSVLLIGIGGSALGVQLVSQALLDAPTRLLSIDNADPRGIVETLATIDPRRTIPVVVTKSGSTAETDAGWRAAKAHWQNAGVSWEDMAIAVTQPDSPFAETTKNWRACFDLWPWVGGRFCVTSAAGLVPLRLLGVDVTAFLRGAALMDAWTAPQQAQNFALTLAHELYLRQRDEGLHSLSTLAYRDRFALLGRYLQQLIMESLGKGDAQGLSVFGQRGSTDQHSILQYLSQGRKDTLTLLIESRSDTPGQESLADAHMARLLGTHQALCAAGRAPIYLSVPAINAQSLGALIALFERSVGYYAGMAQINAYDQPGVEAGKKASLALLEKKAELLGQLRQDWIRCDTLATQLGLPQVIAWRLAMQWVQQGKALHQGQGELEGHEFRALGS